MWPEMFKRIGWHQHPIPTLDQILTLHPPASNALVLNKTG
jgi:hypothetical protein